MEYTGPNRCIPSMIWLWCNGWASTSYTRVRTWIEIGKFLIVPLLYLNHHLVFQDDVIQQEQKSEYQEIKITSILVALQAYHVCKT